VVLGGAENLGAACQAEYRRHGSRAQPTLGVQPWISPPVGVRRAAIPRPARRPVLARSSQRGKHQIAESNTLVSVGKDVATIEHRR
jgi:hypothetical protein